MKGNNTFSTIGHMSQGIWIIDLGQIDHMTPFPMLFNSYFKMTRKLSLQSQMVIV